MNTENLIPFSDRTEENQREIRQKGGLKSGAVRRLKKQQREILREILTLEVTEDEGRKLLIARGLAPDVANGINLAVARKALTGDVEATRYIRDTIGEKPREGIEIGNLDDTPLEYIDLSKLSDDELKAMAAKRRCQDNNNE